MQTFLNLDLSNYDKSGVRVANKCGFSREWVIHEDYNVREWRLDIQEEDGTNFDENKWKMVIDRKVQAYGLVKWRNGIENKVSRGYMPLSHNLRWNFSLVKTGRVPCFSKQDQIEFNENY